FTDGVTEVGRLPGFGERTAVQQDLTVLMIGLEENRYDCRSLDNPSGRGMRIEIHNPVSETTLGRMTFLQVSFSLLVKRSRPRQHWNFGSISAEILEIFAVGCRPDSREVRLAIGSLRRWSEQVRFSIRCPRNPRRGVVQPLRGE